jgi:hypothetical protein
VKGKTSFPLPNVESPLQESPDVQHSHKDQAANKVEDQGDGGYGSGETPTTISPAESTGCISYGSECTVSIHAESGLPGGETRVHASKDTLPFASTQLGPQALLEQLQLRTLDNKDSEDMDNKVHEFMTENNNHERHNTVSLNNN